MKSVKTQTVQGNEGHSASHERENFILFFLYFKTLKIPVWGFYESLSVQTHVLLCIRGSVIMCFSWFSLALFLLFGYFIFLLFFRYLFSKERQKG